MSSNDHKAGSNLEKLLRRGEFVITGEAGPPAGTDVEVVKKKCALIKGYVDAVNVTDNQTSIVRMSSVAASKLIIDEGLEPVLQMTCRDRNRICLQSDLFGAVALGIRNCLCLSGDHQSFGNQIDAKNVYDIDSIQLVGTLKKMRDEGKILGETEIKGDVPVFIGAAANPFGTPYEFRVTRLAKKVAAGADFIQTQCIFNMAKFKAYMAEAMDRGLLENTYMLAGLSPLKSLPMARYMASKVAGMDVPEEIIRRIADAPKKERAKEGIKLCIEQIQELREVPGVAGIHLMAIEWEEKVPEIVTGAGLYPRPVAE